MCEYNSTLCYWKEHTSSTDKVKDIAAVRQLETILFTFRSTPHTTIYTFINKLNRIVKIGSVILVKVT